MKNIANIFIGLVVISFIFFNLSILDTKVDGTTNLNLDKLKIQLAHAAELPELIITCNSGGYGQCWYEDCHWEWTPLGGALMTYCPYFTGSMANICVPEMPC